MAYSVPDLGYAFTMLGNMLLPDFTGLTEAVEAAVSPKSCSMTGARCQQKQKGDCMQCAS